MIRFFTINDPFKLIITLVVLLVLRTALLIMGVPLTLSEIEGMVVGEKMSQGFLLYRDIWTDIPPLTALFYSIVYFVFGKHEIGYRLVSLLVMAINIIYYSNIINKYDAQTEKNYLGGLIYAIMGSMLFVFLTLSGALLSSLFILISFNNLINIIRNGTKSEYVFSAGLSLGVASQFLLSNTLFVIAGIFTLFLLTEFSFKSMFLYLFAFLFPFISISIFFYMFDAYESYYHANFSGIFTLLFAEVFDSRSLLIVFGLPALVFIISIIKLNSSSNFINFQNRCQQLMFFWILCGIATFFMAGENSLNRILVILPSIVFIITQFFILVYKDRRMEWFFMLFAAYISFVPFYGLADMPYGKNLLANQDLLTKYSGKKIVVLENQPEYYYRNYAATPFVKWSESEDVFKNIDNYRNVASIYDGIMNDMPELIVDNGKLFDNAVEKIPALSKYYTQTSESTWELKK